MLLCTKQSLVALVSLVRCASSSPSLSQCLTFLTRSQSRRQAPSHNIGELGIVHACECVVLCAVACVRVRLRSIEKKHAHVVPLFKESEILRKKHRSARCRHRRRRFYYSYQTSAPSDVMLKRQSQFSLAWQTWNVHAIYSANTD